VHPQDQFCHNPTCPARGQYGQGNITIHSQQEQRYRCTVCRRTFSARAGTPYFRGHTPEADQTRILTLLAHGCPLAAAAVAFGYQPRTIRRWVQEAGTHCERVQQHLVEVPRDLGQVQADELRVRTQGGVIWVALALMVGTRLWLGGVVSPQRNYALIAALLARVVRCAIAGPLLVAVDGLAAYVRATERACRTPEPRAGRRGRCRLVIWPELVIGQVVKHRLHQHLGSIERRVVRGSAAALAALVTASQGAGGLNTAYIERLNGTFRDRLGALTRRTRRAARQVGSLHAGVYLVGTVYNFCTHHASLTTQDGRRTPAMAAGITDHCWRVSELLHYQVPLARWQPPQGRGRRSRAMQALIDRWAA